MFGAVARPLAFRWQVFSRALASASGRRGAIGPLSAMDKTTIAEERAMASSQRDATIA
jgi:hypothetical protein